MYLKKIKPVNLAGIALIVTVLVNLPRLLQVTNVVREFSTTFSAVTPGDVLFRFVYLFLFAWIALYFNSNWSYLYKPHTKLKRIITLIAVNSAYLLAAFFLFLFLYPLLAGQGLNTPDKTLLCVVYAVNLIVLVFIAGILRFQVQKEEDSAEKELLKRQSLENELAALKNQINPHFLFNSLNSLNALVRENKEATKFINKLSFMYRYILQSAQTDLISVKEELKFLESYVYLIKTRYRDNFAIKIKVNDTAMRAEIPVLGLQLLVENAVKHNEISKTHPLLVNVFVENDFLIVSNKIQARTTLAESTGNGLANLDKRYVLLKKQHINIEKANGYFNVKLPLKPELSL